MDLEIRWLRPISLLRAGDDEDSIYDIEDIGALPEGPGVYIVGRTHGTTVSPLYVGMATKTLRGRIEQQLNNLRLMRAIDQPARSS